MSEILPFGSGTQYMDWRLRNCQNCKAASPDAETFEGMMCAIERALSECYISGEISPDILERMAFDREAHTWDCPERQTRTEHKCRECARFQFTESRLTGWCELWPPDTDGVMVAGEPACDDNFAPRKEASDV